MDNTTQTVLTPTREEEGWLVLARIRAAADADKQRIYKKWQPFPWLGLSFRWTSPKCLMGRFGGGWQWKLGFQASRGFRAIIFSLLVFSVTVRFGKR